MKREIGDKNIDSALRPSRWEEYIGQEKTKGNLRMIIEAAKMRGEAVDHLLFYGQAGLGKTTLAALVAKETSAPLRIITGSSIEKAGDLAALLSSLEDGEVLFIDEAHRLNPAAEEVLYPAMESRKLHIVIGKGTGAHAVSIDLPPFTLIAATTRFDMLSSPLRSRFGAIFHLEFYTQGEIAEILRRSAKLLSVKADGEGLEVLAKASRFTPRTANRLLKRARDYLAVKNLKVIDKETARAILGIMEIDDLGLEPVERKILELIALKFKKGPVGIRTITAASGEEQATIEEVYEPYLMKLGFIKRTPAGRVLEEEAVEHLRREQWRV
ncbi:MAG: Holliday junction branch migration DNA helicase RuvB [Patescibacteria group bacterium]|nr:Holliday junction branch migration DNA helicase RuvB [Patescibacteria group bacterium]MDE2144755.1 Holliday junction branch migration DNA helicase RuvB [Patescibacteria group bacterium]